MKEAVHQRIKQLSTLLTDFLLLNTKTDV